VNAWIANFQNQQGTVIDAEVEQPEKKDEITIAFPKQVSIDGLAAKKNRARPRSTANQLALHLMAAAA
jgi:hypothetical protein